jgi:hypothetical protein
MGRSPRVLEDQKQQLRLALRSALWDEDAYLLRGYGTSSEREVPYVLPSRGEHGPGQRGRRTEAEYAAAVVAVLDRMPKHLLLHLPRALARLPYLDRMVLHLVVTRGHPYTAVAHTLGWKRPGRVRDTVEQALAVLAQMLYDEDGHARLPPGKEAQDALQAGRADHH